MAPGWKFIRDASRLILLSAAVTGLSSCYMIEPECCRAVIADDESYYKGPDAPVWRLMRVVPWFSGQVRFEGMDTLYLRDAEGFLTYDARERNKRIPRALTALGFDCGKSTPEGYSCEKKIPGFVYCVSREPRHEQFEKKYPAVIHVHSFVEQGVARDFAAADRNTRPCRKFERR